LGQVLGFLRNYPGIWAAWGTADSFERFKDHPDELLRNTLDHPDLDYHSYLWTILDAQLGPAASNELFKQAAFEASGPTLRWPFLFWDNFVSGLLGPGEALFNSGFRTVSLSHVDTFTTVPDSRLPPKMNQEISWRSRRWDLNRLPYGAVYLTRPFVVAGILLVALSALRSPWKAWFLCGVSVWLLQVFVLAVFSSPHVRYTDYLVPLQYMLLAVGAAAWKRERSCSPSG
jgi:hypothetical protein